MKKYTFADGSRKYIENVNSYISHGEENAKYKGK